MKWCLSLDCLLPWRLALHKTPLWKSVSKTTFRAAWAPLCLEDLTWACNATFLIFIFNILVFHFYFFFFFYHKRFDFFDFFSFKTLFVFSVIRCVIRSVIRSPLHSTIRFVIRSKIWSSRVECLFIGFLSPIRKLRRNQAGINILWCLLHEF